MISKSIQEYYIQKGNQLVNKIQYGLVGFIDLIR